MLIIEKQRLNDWVKELAKTMPVFTPVRRNQQGAIESVFEKFKPGTEIDLEYLPTLRSAKEFLYPAKEEIFVFDKSRRKVGTPTETSGKKPFILFGLNLRDLEALTQLDEIMSKPNHDFFYFQKRNSAIIIGVSNEPVKIPPGGDLILAKINEEQYEIIPLNDKGRLLTKNKLFNEKTGILTNGGVKSPEQNIMPKLKQLLYEPELIADAVAWSWKNDLPVWDELAKLCLGCGICTYVCPLCYCFYIEDGTNLDGKTCNRCRKWDACTLPRFAQVTGGFNFHKTIRERYYNWYYHKFVRAYKEYGKSQCVACGRCQKYCPARIDIEKYIVRIVEDYKKTMGLH